MNVLTAPPLTEPADELLLARHRSGDDSALGELFRRYREVAYRVAYRLLGNEADALDALQDGFVKALTSVDGFEGRSSFKTWVLRIVSNAALDLGRARGRRDVLSLDSARGDAKAIDQAEDNPPDRDLDHADLREALDEALSDLPEAQRRTFVLHVDGGMSYREVSQTLGISIGTVMSRLFYARQKLRAALTAKLEP